MSRKDDIQQIDPKKVEARFGLPDYPEKDEKLINLIGKAHANEIPVYYAHVPVSRIKPFCDFKPKKERLDSLRGQILQYLLEGDPQPLLVYPEGDMFVMSDDFHTYNIYLEAGLEIVPCVILGEPDFQGLENVSPTKYS